MKPNSSRSASPRVPAAALILLLLAALGRAASAFYTVSATDVAFADWVSSAAGYAGELIVCARLAVSVGFFTCAAYSSRSEEAENGKRLLLTAVLVSLADYAARFLIDLADGAIAGAVPLAGIWVLLQFLIEAALLWIASKLVRRKAEQFRRAETSKARKAASSSRANLSGTAVFLLLHLLTEAYYLADFLLTYTGITNTEVASIIGSFLRIFVIYGGAAYLIAEGTTAAARNRRSADASEPEPRS